MPQRQMETIHGKKPVHRAVNPFGVGVTLCALLAALPAAAVTPKNKKDKDKKEASSVGPDASLAGDVRRKKPKEEYKPQIDYDAFRFQLELQVADKRRAQMETLQKIIQLGASEKEMPDLVFRYAELAWEESRYFFFQANAKDDEWLAAKNKEDAAGQAKALADKDGEMKKAQQWQAEAITRYKQIVKKYPTYARMDEVLYFLGHNLWDDGNEKDALGIYKLLVTRYTQSKYVPDAYLAFGEYYFNNSKGQRLELTKALSAYKKAASYPENKVYLYALYKQGWCYFNLGDFPQSLDMFKTVIQFADLQSSLNSGNKIKLAKDARRDYVLAYSRYGSALGARDDFEKVGGADNWWPMLKGLAGLYYDDGKDKESVIVYRQLIRERPLSPEAPFFQARIVDAAMRIGIKKITSEQARILVKVLHDVETSGVIKTDADKKLVAEARELAERTLSNLAVTWHNEGKKTRDDETFARADDAYTFYLTIFPDGPKSYDLHFYHGELLFDNLQRYRDGAQEYDKVVALDVQKINDKKKPGRWFQKATEDAVFAWEEVMKAADAKAPKVDASQRGSMPQPIPPEQQGMLQACETYSKYFPKGERSVDVAYKAAQIYYKYNHFPDAVRLFARLIDDHPDNELATYSANLVLDIYNLSGDYQAVLDSARKYLAAPRLARATTKEDVEFREHLPSLIEQAGFKLVEALEKKGQFDLAAQRYTAFAQEFPKNPNADLALWNAANDYGKAGNFQQAIEVRRQLIAAYPRSKFTPKALFGNAQLFEAAADFAPAAAAFEGYAAGYERQAGAAESKGRHKKQLQVNEGAVREDLYEEAKAQEALINSAVYRVGLKQYAEAVRDRETYLKLWPVAKSHNQGDSQSEKVFASIADVEEAQGHVAAAIRQLEEHALHVERDAGAVMAIDYRLAKLYGRLHNTRMAHKLYEAIWDLGKHTNKQKLAPESLDALGHASYELNDATYAEFERLKLRLPEAELVKSVKAKVRALGEVRRVYKETVELRVAEPAICALYKVASAEQSLAQSLYDAPVPANIRANDQLESAYKDALAQQAQPIENAAKADFKSALDQARELGVFDECADKSFDALRRYDPQAYGELPEAIAEVTVATRALNPDLGLMTALQPVAPEPAAPPATQTSNNLGAPGGAPVPAVTGVQRGPVVAPPLVSPPVSDVAQATPALPADPAPDANEPKD